MIEEAWRQYIGWAAQARAMQKRARFWNKISFGAAVLAAIFGTLATQLTDLDGHQSMLYALLAASAAIASAVYTWIGKDGIGSESEQLWTKARAAAEAIKSESYRFAGGVAGYANSDSPAQLFRTRIAQLKKDAVDAGVTPSAPNVEVPNSRPIPVIPMTAARYLDDRIGDQLTYFHRDLVKARHRITTLRLASGFAMIAAAVCGATTALSQDHIVAGWIGVITTIVAALSAQGLADRNRLTCTKAGMMIDRLEDIKLEWSAGGLSLPELIEKTEMLMEAEHGLWIQLMAKSTLKNEGGVPKAEARDQS
jgi:hypothetical protein